MVPPHNVSVSGRSHTWPGGLSGRPTTRRIHALRNRYFPVVLLTTVLGLASLAGYLTPRDIPSAPVRIMLANPGGAVVFTHKVHATRYGDPCSACHHADPGDFKTPMPCVSCHPPSFGDDFRETHADAFDSDTACVTCHHTELNRVNFAHRIHAEEYAAEDCTACHHENNPTPAKAKCSNCHGRKADGVKLGLKQAVHTRCADCHEDYFAEELHGCGHCHSFRTPDPGDTYSDCSECHDKPVEDLIPPRVKAFHGQCMGCHREKRRGPFGNDSCTRCHLR